MWDPIKDNKLLAEIDRHEEFVAADFYMWNLNSKSILRILFLSSLVPILLKFSIDFSVLGNPIENPDLTSANAFSSKLHLTNELFNNINTSS